jgi:hypothetical protein
MLQSLSQQDKDEKLMRNVDDETKATLSAILSLEMDEQRAHDIEFSQFHDDVLHHLNSQTEEIIQEIECIDSDESDPGVDELNGNWYHQLPDSPTDDNSENGIDHDTDTEDDVEEHISLVQSNMKLIVFLARQSKTIARLRTRIRQLRLHVSELTSRVDNSPTTVTTDIANESSAALTFYGIQGRHAGVCDSWDELQRRIDGTSNPRFQSFSNWQAAKEYVIDGMWNDMPEEAKCYATPPTSTHTSTNNAHHPYGTKVEADRIWHQGARTAQGAELPLSPIPDATDEYAKVLVEIDSDTTLLIAPSRCQVITTEHLSSPTIKSQLATQLDKIKTSKNTSQEEIWMYFDSGASRSVISPNSPIRSQLHAVTPAYGSCSIGDRTHLQYIEKGHVNTNLEITVVKDLKYDLFSSVSAAKQGLTSIIDFGLQTGQNNSYTIDKTTGIVTPLVERGKGILELPLHLMLPPSACFTVIPAKGSNQDALPPNVVSMFWHCYDDVSFDPTNRDNNQTEYSLFTFDIIKSLSERERDFLIHARLEEEDPTDDKKRDHRNQRLLWEIYGIMQAMHAGKATRGEPRPRTQAAPKGRPGEHLHSDLAVLSTPDLNGNKYALTVVDEISHELVIALLKRKTADEVYRVCKKIQLSISARTGNKLLTW